MRYHTILFDLDGTLLDTLEDLTDAVNYVMDYFGYPRHSIDEIRMFVGNGIRRLIVCCMPAGEQDPYFAEGFQMFLDYYGQHADVKTRPYPGVLELLKELKKRGIAMAIVSNKAQSAVTDLAGKYFADFITVAVGDGEGRARKPAPDAPLEALRRLQNQTDRAPERAGVLYVGDSEVDAATAENAALDCLLVTWGFRSRELLRQQKCIGMIERPQELLQKSFLTE